MATHVITVKCDSPADAARALEQIREIGFPIEGEQIDGGDVLIWINQHQTDGIHHPLEQIRKLGYKPWATSERMG